MLYIIHISNVKEGACAIRERILKLEFHLFFISVSQPQHCYCHHRYRSRVLGIVYKAEHLLEEKLAWNLLNFACRGSDCKPRPAALRRRIICFYSGRSYSVTGARYESQ